MATLDDISAEVFSGTSATPTRPKLDDISNSVFGLSAGPVDMSPTVAALVKPPDEQPSNVKTLGTMPFGFRFNLQMRRDDPKALLGYLQTKGFTLGEPDPSGRLIIKDKYGNMYDANEALLGQEAITRGVPYVLEGASAAAGAVAGHPHIGVMAGSAASDAYGNLLDMAAGLPPKRSVEDIAKNAGIAELLNVGMMGLGKAGAEVSGLGGLRRGATKATEELRSAVGTQREKLGDVALEQAHPEVFRTELANVLKIPETDLSRAVPARTLDEMTQRVGPLKASVKQSVARNFEELSKGFDDVLLPHAQIPVTPTAIQDSANAFRQDIIGEKTISGPLKKLFERVDDMGGETPTDPAILRNIERLKAAGDNAGAAALSQLHGVGAQGVNVKQALDLRQDFSKLYRSSTSNLERSAARNMIESIDETLAGVIPEADQPRLANLRANWGFATNLYDQSYRRALRGAENPAEVARVLYDSSTSSNRNATGKIALVMRDLEQNDPASIPIVRHAFADHLLSGDDPAKALRSMNPQVFKSIFGMKQTPEELATALENKIDVNRIMEDPQGRAAFDNYFSRGMASMGQQVREKALAAAERNLQNLPDAEGLVKQAAMKGMQQPLFGNWNRYLEHRLIASAAFSVLANGIGYGTGFTASGIAASLIYVTGSAGSKYLLSKPAIAEPYYKMLTSKTREQFGYYAGRMTAAALAEKAKQSREDQ